jgi:hypothetical protein
VFSFRLIDGGAGIQFSPQMSTEIHYIGTLTLARRITNCPGFISELIYSLVFLRTDVMRRGVKDSQFE